MDAEAATAGGGGARGAVAALAAGETLAWAGMFYVFPALLPRWEAAFAGAGPPVALGMSLALGVSALTAPLAGRLIDAGRAPLLMPVSALLGAGLMAVASQAQSATAFVAVWTLLGLAMSGALYEPCFALLTRARGAAARRAIATVTLAAGFATAVSYPLSAALDSAFGWRGALLGMAAMVGLLAAPLLGWGARMAERTAAPDSTARAAPPAGPAPGWRAQWRRPGVIRIAVAFASVAGAHALVTAHMLPLLADRGVTGAAAVWVASMVGPMQVAGRVALLSAPGRWRAAGLSVAALAMFSAGAATLLAGGGLVAAAAFAALIGAANGTATILRPAALAEAAGTERFGALAGLVATPVVTAYAVAPAIGAALRGLGGADLALGFAAALPLVGLAAIAPLARRP